LNDQLAQARAEATSARQAAEDSRQFRERSKVDAISAESGLPAYVDMSDEAVYARRARIAMQMRSVIESIACSPDHTVKIVMKTGTAYELVEKEWICTKQGPLTPAGKPAVARFFVGRATWQLGQVEEPIPDGHDGTTTACSGHSRSAAKGKRSPETTGKRPRSAATPEPHELCRKMPSLLGRSRVHPMLKEWAQEHVFGADALARPAHAVFQMTVSRTGPGLSDSTSLPGFLSMNRRTYCSVSAMSSRLGNTASMRAADRCAFSSGASGSQLVQAAAFLRTKRAANASGYAAARMTPRWERASNLFLRQAP